MKPFLVLFCTVGSSPVLLASHPWSPAYKSRNEFKTLFFGVIFWSHLEVLRSRIFWTLVLIEISSTSYFGFEPSSSAMAPALLSLFNYLSAENHLFITFLSLGLVPCSSSNEWHYFWYWVDCCQTFYCPSFFYNISQQHCQPFLQGACCAIGLERRN